MPSVACTVADCHRETRAIGEELNKCAAYGNYRTWKRAGFGFFGYDITKEN